MPAHRFMRGCARSIVVPVLTAAAVVLSGCGGAPAKVERKSTAPAGTYALWPQFPNEPRIQFLRSFAASSDVTPGASSGFQKLVFGSNARNEEGIQKPYGVASKDGRIYVCDIRNASLTVLDLRKQQTRLIGTSGSNALKHPVDVAIADDNSLYVADNERSSVFVFDASERFSKIFGYAGLKPVSVAVHGDRLYVCDMNAHTVEIFDRFEGKRLGTIGSVGDGDGQFRVPLGVDTDAKGNVYVMDMMRCRLQKFGPNGAYLSGVGAMGDYVGAFVRPKHVAVDNDGIMYVVDSAFQNVQMFDDQNRMLMAFGAAGNFPGSMNLPVGICVTDTGLDLFQKDMHPGFVAKRLIFVTNQFGQDKVSVYAYGERRKDYALQDLASSTALVGSGTGTSPERLQMAAPGTEPVSEADAPADAAPEGAPGTPPSEPKPR